MASLLRENVDLIRKKRGLSRGQLAERVKRGRSEVDKALDSDEPPKTLVAALADQLVVPELALFMIDPHVADGLIDFRSDSPGTTAYQRNTLKAIEAGRNILDVANLIEVSSNEETIADFAHGDSIKERAASLRRRIEIKFEDQLESKDARVFYNLVRQKIEKLNVFVTQYSFDDGAGFCITREAGSDYICINTKKQTYQRRLFTLGHEVYHCIINKSGLSDPELARNSIERQCNKFAAEFLTPERLVKGIYKRYISSNKFEIHELSQFAKASKLSLYASVLRLVELDIYNRDALAAWSAFSRQHRNPDSESRQGGQRVEEWKYKLARYGFKFAEFYGKALKDQKVDELEIFRLTRLKPKYQAEYFEHASSARPEDVEDE